MDELLKTIFFESLGLNIKDVLSSNTALTQVKGAEWSEKILEKLYNGSTFFNKKKDNTNNFYFYVGDIFYRLSLEKKIDGYTTLAFDSLENYVFKGSEDLQYMKWSYNRVSLSKKDFINLFTKIMFLLKKFIPSGEICNFQGYLGFDDASKNKITEKYEAYFKQKINSINAIFYSIINKKELTVAEITSSLQNEITFNKKECEFWIEKIIENYPLLKKALNPHIKKINSSDATKIKKILETFEELTKLLKSDVLKTSKILPLLDSLLSYYVWAEGSEDSIIRRKIPMPLFYAKSLADKLLISHVFELYIDRCQSIKQNIESREIIKIFDIIKDNTLKKNYLSGINPYLFIKKNEDFYNLLISKVPLENLQVIRDGISEVLRLYSAMLEIRDNNIMEKFIKNFNNISDKKLDWLPSNYLIQEKFGSQPGDFLKFTEPAFQKILHPGRERLYYKFLKNYGITEFTYVLNKGLFFKA